MSRSSSISSTSGLSAFVTPPGSILSLPLQDEVDTGSSHGNFAAKIANRYPFDLGDPIDPQAGYIRDESDSADTEVAVDAKPTQHTLSAPSSDLFLEHLSNSSRSSLNGSDQLEEELAELGIYDSELLQEDSSTESESGNDEHWEDPESGQHGDSGSPLIDRNQAMLGKRRTKRRTKWKEAEEELQRGGNRSLVEVPEIVKAGGLAIAGPDASLNIDSLEGALTAFITDEQRRGQPDISTSLVNAGTAVMPYYLLAKEPSSVMPSLKETGRLAGIFEVLQVGRTDLDGNRVIGEGFKTDDWLNFARVCMITLILHNIVLWVAQAKDISLRALGIRREGRAKAQRWLSACFWTIVTGIACIGGSFADRLEWIGAACVLSVGWLLPVFPTGNNPYRALPDPTLPILGVNGPDDTPLENRESTMGLGVQDVMEDPSTDMLLARKERQLQKRRSGRRMWQDLIVFLGILPMGIFTVLWCVGVTIGLIPA
ncbi:hypothetical protein QFC19_003616 [Naganishia cerealis]|uniref:Uncharacterized protein n=1 Tax=Naganishia cerealis TaxID=610337 RepID=A0ACC2W0M2_9TREE|nr:hypothetical protein QFC19_003616 [Naganishia cerealis]